MPGELGDADETIKVKFAVDTQKAIAEAKALREEIDALKAHMKTVAKETGATTQVAVQSVLNTTTQTAKGAGAIAKQEYTKAEKAASGFKDSLSSLGTIGKYVFGTILGLSAVQVLRNIIQYFQQAAQYGYEFAKAVYQLSIGINAIRRTGTDITLQDMYENLDKLQAKFGIFSRKELVEGAAQLINLTRDFGFTKDKIFELQDAIATLAVVNGRAMDDVQRTVALAISSGYTEGLQRLGVSINRVTIALEAQRLGWGRNYMSLTEQQRAQATYNLILRKTAKYQDDLREYQNTAPGKIDKAKRAFTDFTTKLGENVIPAFAALADILTTVLDRLTHFMTKIQESRLPEWIMKLSEIAPFLVGAASYSWAKSATDKGLSEPSLDTGWLKNRIAEEEKLYGELQVWAEETGDKILEIEKDFEQDSADAWEDYLQNKEDLFIQYNQKAEDIERDFVQKLEDIDLKVTQKKEDAWTDYYQGIADINDWYNQAVEEANYNHQQDLLKAEEEFQNEMRDLRQRFLFDLEDAVRERDAKQAMLLIRQYNFDRQQAQQSHEDDQDEINENYKHELAELKKQKARKLAELKDELNRKFAQIQLEYQRELAELDIWKQREYEERELWYQRELEQAKTNYDRHIEELQLNRTRQLKELSKTMAEEYKLQGNHLNDLFKLIEAYIGANGYITKLWQAYNDYISQSAAVPSTTLTPQQQFNWGGSYAGGGSIVANKPTLALFGERGAERATFTPLSKGKGGIEGKVQIEVLLSPDLEARIIDSAVGEVANEFETVVSIRK